MKKIPLMNVTRQYRSIQSEIEESVLKVLRSGQYIMNEHAKESQVVNFEAEYADYIGVKYAIAVGNGTDALVIALKAAQIGAGDEVITSAMSFFATAEAIALTGAVPVFVDCLQDTYTLDSTQLENRITNKTKAVIPVHLYGQCAEMDEMNRIAKKHGLTVIEDMAQASGALYRGKKAGSLGDMGCVSFFPTKNLGCAGDGGMIVTNNRDFYYRAKAFRVHGSGAAGRYTELRNAGTDEEDIDIENMKFHGNQPKYYNFVTGHNSRLDEIQAAVLRKKLPYLDQWNQMRAVLASKYNRIVNSKIRLPLCKEYNRHVYYTYVVMTQDRDKLKKYLEDNGIGTGIYFPVPLHLQEAFRDLGYRHGDFPAAEGLAWHSLAIPMFPELSQSEADYIIDTINRY